MNDTGSDIDGQIAARLRAMRQARGWSLDDLARLSGVSRATLSRLENAEVSATASVLGRLASAHAMPLSRLIYLVEEDFSALVTAADQPVLVDAEHGFVRRSVSPPARSLTGEVISCEIAPGQVIAYATPPRPGLEHHLVMLDGELQLTVDGVIHQLSAGDCLRYRLEGASTFRTGPERHARYLLFIV